MKAGFGDGNRVSSQNLQVLNADADSSGKNVRDPSDASLTPGDQGNSAGDREITQKVRQTLVSGTNV